MSFECEGAKLSAEEIAEIYRNMEAKGLDQIFCQACSEEMLPEQAMVFLKLLLLIILES